ncbi:MAG TPA: C1 family peptidase [Isosphaeraceae bacterium]|nr:C1 family peptidase [Isosphaeraceae bacterium]
MTVRRGKIQRARPAGIVTPAGYQGTPRKVQRYGWVPDLPDQRDHTFAVAAPLVTNLPESVDLRDQCPEVYNQGDLGSCTANAIAAALQFDRMKQKLDDFTPSRLFIYYNERVLEGTVASDSGAQLRDGIKSVATQGDCPETEWPYDISKFADAPPQSCYRDARKYKAVQYQSVTQNLADMQGCLASGYPFVFGFTAYESFESDAVAQTGNLPMPKSGEPIVGGHAVLAVGYDNDDRVFIVRNSWGEDWGDAGYFYMSYAYLLDDNLADDFWTIRLVK